MQDERVTLERVPQLQVKISIQVLRKLLNSEDVMPWEKQRIVNSLMKPIRSIPSRPPKAPDYDPIFYALFQDGRSHPCISIDLPYFTPVLPSGECILYSVITHFTYDCGSNHLSEEYCKRIRDEDGATLGIDSRQYEAKEDRYLKCRGCAKAWQTKTLEMDILGRYKHRRADNTKIYILKQHYVYKGPAQHE